MVRNLPIRRETRSIRSGRFPGKGMATHCSLLFFFPLQYLPGESHGHRGLAGYSSWGHKEWDMTERLTL